MSKLYKALQRASTARRSGHKFDDSLEESVHPLLKTHGIEIQPEVPNNIEVKYSKTKVERVDRTILRRNKVFSLFKEDHITDQVDNLRTQILEKLAETGGNSLLVTSAHPGKARPLFLSTWPSVSHSNLIRPY
jgi:hypothetical protein